MHPKDEKKIRQQVERKDQIRLPDDMNPQYLFSLTHVDLLVQIAKGTIRTKKVAIKELRKRGLNRDGLWDSREYEMER